MPYIKEEYKQELKPVLDDLYDTIICMPEEVEDGVITYVIFKLMKDFYYADSYSRLKDGVGILDCVNDEFKRRYLHPHEDRKIKENGDV